MNTKKFGGFTEEQMAAIARKMGHKGPMEKFNDFLAESPDRMDHLSRMTKLAQNHVEGNYAAGGHIRDFDSKKAKERNDARRKAAELPAYATVDRADTNNDGTLSPEERAAAHLDPTGAAMPVGQTAADQHYYDPPDSVAARKRQAARKAEANGTGGTGTGSTAGLNPQQLTNDAFNNPESMVTPTKVTNTRREAGQFVDPNAAQVDANGIHANTATATNTNATAAAQTPTAHATTTTTAAGVNAATQDLTGVHGTVSQGAQAVAAQALPSANATVQGQLEQLMAQFEGGATPPWAAGALRKANALSAARGLGSSSMAGAANTQALMESALTIAVQDASTYSAFEMKNLDNRQQAALQNAQAFLQMDLANLSNDQQASMLKTQLRTQALFTDAAAQNATSQFNATSDNQANQFFASLKTQVSQFNAAQQNATSQFNAGATNQMAAFNAQLQDQREQFNAQNQLIILQSNAKWRQQIATQDNANINEANRINAQAANGLTAAAYANMWQQERDLMAFAFTGNQNDLQRAHEIVLQKMGGKAANQQALYQAGGNLVGQIVRNVDWGDMASKLFGG